MSEHTKGPWLYDEILGACYVIAGSKHVLSYVYSPDEENRANARRVVACVNACEGMDDPGATIKELQAENTLLRQNRQQIEDEIWERINQLFTDQDAVFWKEIEIWCHHTGPLVKNAIIGDRQIGVDINEN